MKKIIVITTSGGNREDGNVYYSKYLIVSSDTLQFDEPIFADENYGPRGYRELRTDDDCSDNRMTAAIDEIKALGYTVEEPDLGFVEIEVG